MYLQTKDRLLSPAQGGWQAQRLGGGELGAGHLHWAGSCDPCPHVEGMSGVPLSSHHISLYFIFPHDEQRLKTVYFPSFSASF